MKAMQTVQEFDYSALQWVKGEIDETLNRARQALDAYYEDPDEVDQVRLCANYLHQVHGTLQMTELDGPARMAEAMETAANGLLELDDEERLEDAIEVLMRATLQLPDYLDRLLAGHRDIPEVLLPLINELRASVGRETLSPVDLFYPDLSIRPPHVPDRPLGDVRLSGRRLRPLYQTGLVEWLRDPTGRKGLAKLGSVVEELRLGAGLPDAERLWWVASGFIEVLEGEGPLDAAAKADFRPLLAHLDRFVKRLVDAGEGALTLRETGSSINRMLYHVGRSEVRGSRADDLRDAFGLDGLLTPESEIVAVREGLASANLSLMQTVSKALKEDLTGIMERIDVFTRQPEKNLEDLPPLVNKLDLMSDTLAMLGSSEGPRRLREQSAVLSEMAEGGRASEPAGLLAVARGLVEVEGILEELSRGNLTSRSGDEESQARVRRRQLFETVVKQAKVNTEKVKDVIADHVKNPRADTDLGVAVQRLEEIRGGLRVLELDRPAELFGRCAAYVGTGLTDVAAPEGAARSEHLAEAVSGLEYYLEGLVQGRGEQTMLLDRIETVIGRLGEVASEARATGESKAPFSTAEVGPKATGMEMEDLGTLSLLPVESAGEAEVPAAPQSRESAPAPEAAMEFTLGEIAPPAPEEPAKEFEFSPASSSAAEEPEKEFTFGEVPPKVPEEPAPEPGETTTDLGFGALPPTASEPSGETLDFGALPPLVPEEPEQAFTFGETPPNEPAPPRSALLGSETSENADQEPEREFTFGEAPTTVPEPAPRAFALDEVAPIESEPVAADASAGGEGTAPATEAAPEIGAEEAREFRLDASPEAASAPPDFTLPEQAMDVDADPELLEIFIEEARGELEAMDEQLPRWQRDPGDTEALTVLRRSFHTLKGSGRMVGAWLMGEYAWSFENLLNRVLDGTAQATPDLVRLVGQSREAVEGLVTQLEGGSEPGIDLETMMRQAWALSRGQAVEIGTQAPSLLPPATETPIPPAVAVEQEGVAEETGEAFEFATPGAAPPSEEGVAAAPERDPVLVQIFAEEAEGHLEAIQSFVRTCTQSGGDACLLDSTVLRALHTLVGSSRMVEVEEVGDIAAAVQDYAKAVAALQEPVSEQGAGLLRDCSTAIKAILSALEAGAKQLPDHDEVAKRAFALLDEVRARPAREAAPAVGKPVESHAFLDEAGRLLADADEALKAWRDDRDPVAAGRMLHASVEALRGQSRQAEYQSIAGLADRELSVLDEVWEGRLSVSDALFGMLGRIHERVWTLAEQAREGHAAASSEDLLQAIDDFLAKAQAPEETVPEAFEEIPAAPAEERPAAVVASLDEAAEPPLDVDYGALDGDMLQVFVEEGEDIVNNSENLIRRLSADPTDVELVNELRRDLHTLKGGARLAGLASIGDVAHSVESLLQGVFDGHLTASETAFELIQAGHDQLSDMVDGVREEAPLASPKALLNRLHEYVSQGVRRDLSVDEIAELADAEKPSEFSTVVLGATEKPAPSEPESERRGEARVKHEQVRVRADLLNQLVNFAGEASITRSRIEEQVTGFGYNLQELEQTVGRLREQLRKLEIETEAQILFRHETEAGGGHVEFDPLELDRYSTVQQLSRSLMESVADFYSIHGLLSDQSRDAETLLLQQARINTELQEGLMRARMVPFAGLAPRLRRIVRQTAKELGKQAELFLEGADTELDRAVMDRMVAPLEHLLRNAVSHGIEPPGERKEAGKKPAGTIKIALRREGQEVVIQVTDDGRGLDLKAIRRKAIQQHLMSAEAQLTDREVMQFILESGFSTAKKVSQISGRGVGLDVVGSEVKQTGGGLYIDSRIAQWTAFTIRLPLTLTVNQALLVEVAEELYAIPLLTIEGVIKLDKRELEELYSSPAPELSRGGRTYQFLPMAALLDVAEETQQVGRENQPLLLFSVGDMNMALAIDGLLGAREIVVKSLGAQLGRVREISGATILGDGRVVLILDMGSLLRKSLALYGTQVPAAPELPQEERKRTMPRVLVVDDSITVRKVTAHVLKRHHLEVVAAKDGVDAVAFLEQDEAPPEVILMDIEMPRMDGFELAGYVRNNPRLKGVPIIMITSRTGTKHRERAAVLGVNRYLGKPYQESELVDAIRDLIPVD